MVDIKIFKTLKRFAALVIILILVFSFGLATLAATPYESYTYSYNGDVQISPNAYSPYKEYSKFDKFGALKSPTDIIVDTHGNIVVADKDNNRILVMNIDFVPITSISDFNANGKPESLKGPQGIFSVNDMLYVADTENARIVVFDASYNFVRIIEAPSVDILPKGFIYKPKSIAVDNAGRIYVLSLNTNMGVIALNKDGGFEGFIGAQRVAANAMELFIRMFMTEEQIERSISFVPMEFSNLTMDAKGFVYVTASSIDRYSLFTAVESRSSSSTYAPIKKMNPSGTDVLRRNGFFPPVGDINFDAYANKPENLIINPSSIIEVCLLNNGLYCLLDNELSKIFVYDSYGNLLYAFGGNGIATGLYSSLCSVAYAKDTMYTLDSVDGSITVLKKTDYGKLLDEVIALQDDRQFDNAVLLWQDVITYNNNFDLAYLGIGKALLEKGEHVEAMSYFQLINNQSFYSKAFKLYRQELLQKYGFFVLLISIFLIICIVKLFAFAKRYNKKGRITGSKRNLAGELMYAFYIIFHPFDGFWDLKHEKRGSVKSASIILLIVSLTFAYKSFGSGYLFKPINDTPNLLSVFGGVLLPFTLWCVASWCLTSLMDGKGNFKDIYVYSCYALVPLVIFMIPITIITNLFITEEANILVFVLGIGYVWAAVLLFFGSLTTHDYSLGKNIIVTILTFIAIGFILFLMMIFFNLIGNMATFFSNIVNEITYRM